MVSRLIHSFEKLAQPQAKMVLLSPSPKGLGQLERLEAPGQGDDSHGSDLKAFCNDMDGLVASILGIGCGDSNGAPDASPGFCSQSTPADEAVVVSPQVAWTRTPISIDQSKAGAMIAEVLQGGGASQAAASLDFAPGSLPPPLAGFLGTSSVAVNAEVQTDWVILPKTQVLVANTWQQASSAANFWQMQAAGCTPGPSVGNECGLALQLPEPSMLPPPDPGGLSHARLMKIDLNSMDDDDDLEEQDVCPLQLDELQADFELGPLQPAEHATSDATFGDAVGLVGHDVAVDFFWQLRRRRFQWLARPADPGYWRGERPRRRGLRSCRRTASDDGQMLQSGAGTSGEGDWRLAFHDRLPNDVPTEVASPRPELITQELQLLSSDADALQPIFEDGLDWPECSVKTNEMDDNGVRFSGIVPSFAAPYRKQEPVKGTSLEPEASVDVEPQASSSMVPLTPQNFNGHFSRVAGMLDEDDDSDHCDQSEAEASSTGVPALMELNLMAAQGKVKDGIPEQKTSAEAKARVNADKKEVEHDASDVTLVQHRQLVHAFSRGAALQLEHFLDLEAGHPDFEQAKADM